ncbi:hybrid sensor histidine kinase/response regulator transcription factor [Mariniflexile fucanivorans]|uniref:hybrid sensor histidine kinase/response regulator transcription factor n=1 Tax=Mariniflexile fucanivorans TaxID=264023 RepID=UPI001A9F9124|nr:two-component regulator propeller domain-containing protein [Mariniflexile fucanivorans]
MNIQGAPFNQKVNVLFEDSTGFLWIGTNTGLYRYDGNNLIQYQNDVFNSFSIPNNNINSIIEDNNQNLWIGSESFLVYYNRKQNKFKGFYKNITSTVLYKTSDGKIIANPKNTGLVTITPDKDFDKTKLDSHFNYQNNPNLLKFNKQISAFVEDTFKRYWIGTDKGIYLLDSNGKYIQTNFNSEIIAMKNVTDNSIIVLTKKNLYLLGYNKTNHNLEILESYVGIMDSFEKGSSLSSISLSPYNKNLWIGTTNGLVKAVRNNNKYQFNYYSKEFTNSNLINDQVNSTTYDSYGNLWIGSAKGINKLLGRTSLFNFYNLSMSTKLKNLNTQNILFNSENNILIGTNKGIYKYNPKTNVCNEIKTNFPTEVNNIGKIVGNFNNSELLLSSNNILFETIDYNPESTNFKLKKLKTFRKRITDIAIINQNESWIGLWDGGIGIVNNVAPLSEFKKEIIKKLSNNHTSAFLVTTDNMLWIGTRGEGLFKVDFNNETLEEYLPNKDGLSSNAILSLHEDSNKTIWIGTRGGGLNYYIEDHNSFKNFNKTSGLAPNTVAAIEEDSNGNLWMSTQEGLTRLDVLTEKFIPFGIEDGIKEVYFTFNSSSSNKNKKKLYFGNTDGFYTVFVDKFLPKEKVPATVITSFTRLGDSKSKASHPEFNASSSIDINSEEPTVLTYDQNNIVINFSSLDLTTPNKNEYAYMLEGLNDYWVYTTASNRNANYNDLPPGTYTFKVKSANSDGVWNENPTLLHFKITPPFWKSNLAYFIYGLLAVIILYICYLLIKRWYKLKKNLVKETISREKDNEHNRMKMVFFTDISHELRTPLSLILGTIEKVVKEKEFMLSAHTAQRIYNNTLRMHRLINQIMDIRKFDVGKFNLSISKNDIVKDVNIIKDSFNDFARIYGITYVFISKEEKIKGWYDVDILEKTLFNLLSNAFKYTKEKGAISVSLEIAGKEDSIFKTLESEKNTYIKCSVKDNGMGIPEKDLQYIFDRYYQATKSYSNQVPGTGIGMELVHKLIKRHHGEIVVESKENVYTEFTFYLPINKDRYCKNERIKTGMPLKRNFIQNSEFQIIEEVSTEFEEKKNSNKNPKPKILIVEDNDDLRRMVKEELKPDFYILEAPNGKEGYEIILNEKPLLIISDILMPVEDGISMLKRIKANKEICNIPIFMLTAKNSEETKIECLSLGADDYIEKPFSMEFVKWKVKNALVTRNELKEKYSKVITPEPSLIETDSNDEKFIKKLITIIENSMNNNLLSVEYLASEAGMSRANLYRKLQTIANDTPVNFIKTIKLKRATQLLKKNDLYISEIAYMTGFNNQKYFGKCFHKEYKMSPTEYIKKYADKKN